MSAMDYTKFNRYEYHAIPFVENIFGENYIMKTHNHEKDCFSMCAPDQNILNMPKVLVPLKFGDEALGK